jgi:hypothetical protein
LRDAATIERVIAFLAEEWTSEADAEEQLGAARVDVEQHGCVVSVTSSSVTYLV